jgi:hypothetical protein
MTSGLRTHRRTRNFLPMSLALFPTRIQRIALKKSLLSNFFGSESGTHDASYIWMRRPVRIRLWDQAGPDKQEISPIGSRGGIGFLLDRSLQQPLVVDNLRGGDRDACAAGHSCRRRPEAGRASEFCLMSCRIVHQERHYAWFLVGAAAPHTYSRCWARLLSAP